MLLGIVLLSAAQNASAGQSDPVLIGGTTVPRSAVRSAIERCERDLHELPLPDCLQQFQVPIWRLNAEADRRFTRTDPLRRELEQRMLAERLIETLLLPPSEAAIDAYLEQHAAEWKTPQRLRLFRILVASRGEAEELLAKLERATVADFRTAARAHSIDRSSHERGGDLGFVAADGTTDLPSVRAEPSLFAAAVSVVDGAFVPKPVPEGDSFAVVWRRGSLPARTLERGEARAWATARLREQHAAREIERIVLAQPSVRHLDLLARLRRAECHLFDR